MSLAHLNNGRVEIAGVQFLERLPEWVDIA